MVLRQRRRLTVNKLSKVSGEPFRNQFSSRLAEVAAQMEDVLNEHLGFAGKAYDPLIEAMRYAVLGGGKRLRPFLLIETARMFGAPNRAAWDSAAALECLHVYSLIHDDLPCMDDDDLRRGKPTVHRAFDEAVAVLAGDGLLTLSFDVLAGISAPDAIKVKLISRLAGSGGIHGMIGGQMMDISVAEDQRDIEFISELQACKTGALIEFAVDAGAIISNASDVERESLRAFARDLGLAFQIKDDLLDVEGDVETVGKAVGKDADLGKATFVSILGLEGAREKAAELGERAKRRLDPFGEKAEILCDTVDFVLKRSH